MESQGVSAPLERLLGRALVAIAMVGALAHAIHFDHTCDDAFISFQYARNLVDGHGLVFNPGERIQGYSDLLWVLLLAAFDAAGVPPPDAARLLGTVFAWGTLLVVHAALRRRGASLAARAAALGMLSASGVFALWMFGGLEGHLLAFLVLSAAVAARELPVDGDDLSWLGVGILLGLASLTRPDGILFAGPVALAPILAGGRRGMRAAGVVVFAAAVPYLAAASWQFWYYGSPVPNTYYAKVQPVSAYVLRRGVAYTLRYWREYLGLPIVVPVAWLVFRKGAGDRRGWVLFGVWAAFVAYYLRIGGDALVYYRMWLVTLPCLALMAAEVVDRVRDLGRTGPVLAAACALLVIGLNLPASFAGRDIDHLRRDDGNLRDLERIAKVLGRLPPDTLLAANVVGVLTYESRLRMLDMLGLNDAHIARAPRKAQGIPGHEAHDGRYVLARRPDVILSRYPVLLPFRPDWQEFLSLGGYPSDLDLFSRPELAQAYDLRYLELDGKVLPLLVRREFAERAGM